LKTERKKRRKKKGKEDYKDVNKESFPISVGMVPEIWLGTALFLIIVLVVANVESENALKT